MNNQRLKVIRDWLDPESKAFDAAEAGPWFEVCRELLAHVDELQDDALASETQDEVDALRRERKDALADCARITSLITAALPKGFDVPTTATEAVNAVVDHHRDALRFARSALVTLLTGVEDQTTYLQDMIIAIDGAVGNGVAAARIADKD